MLGAPSETPSPSSRKGSATREVNRHRGRYRRPSHLATMCGREWCARGVGAHSSCGARAEGVVPLCGAPASVEARPRGLRDEHHGVAWERVHEHGCARPCAAAKPRGGVGPEGEARIAAGGGADGGCGGAALGARKRRSRPAKSAAQWGRHARGRERVRPTRTASRLGATTQGGGRMRQQSAEQASKAGQRENTKTEKDHTNKCTHARTCLHTYMHLCRHARLCAGSGYWRTLASSALANASEWAQLRSRNKRIST